jgi:hypothetical protein
MIAGLVSVDPFLDDRSTHAPAAFVGTVPGRTGRTCRTSLLRGCREMERQAGAAVGEKSFHFASSPPVARSCALRSETTDGQTQIRGWYRIAVLPGWERERAPARSPRKIKSREPNATAHAAPGSACVVRRPVRVGRAHEPVSPFAVAQRNQARDSAYTKIL